MNVSRLVVWFGRMSHDAVRESDALDDVGDELVAVSAPPVFFSVGGHPKDPSCHPYAMDLFVTAFHGRGAPNRGYPLT